VGPATAVDTNAYILAFPGRGTVDPRWTKVAREILAGRDIRVPEAMIEELAQGSGLSRAQILDDLATLGRRSSTIPEAAKSTREAIERVAKARVRKDPFDPRIGASAAELGEVFATGDQNLARAVFKSGLMTREQILSLQPPGVIPGHGWDNSMLAIIVALGLVGGADAVTPEHERGGGVR
jgi:rRNA-processing protein FCF1